MTSPWRLGLPGEAGADEATACGQDSLPLLFSWVSALRRFLPSTRLPFSGKTVASPEQPRFAVPPAPLHRVVNRRRPAPGSGGIGQLWFSERLCGSFSARFQVSGEREAVTQDSGPVAGDTHWP